MYTCERSHTYTSKNIKTLRSCPRKSLPLWMQSPSVLFPVIAPLSQLQMIIDRHGLVQMQRREILETGRKMARTSLSAMFCLQTYYISF